MKRLADLREFEKAQELIGAIFSGKYRFIIYGGAIRGGKSFNLLMGLVMLLRKYPGARAAIIRRDMETLKRNTYPTCQKIFPKRFMKIVNRSSYIWEGQNQLYKQTENRSYAFFFGENYDKDKELQRWDGLEVNFLFIDQIEEIQEETLTKAFERTGSYFIPGIRKEEQPLPIVLASCNPTKNWVKRQIYDRYVEGTLPDDWLYIPANIDDNPHVPQTYKDSIEQMKFTRPEEYKRRRHGDWNYLEGEDILFNEPAIEDSFTNTYVQHGFRCITADIAMKGSDFFVIGIWSGWRLEKIEYYEKSDGKEVLEALHLAARRHRIPYSHICYDADGLGNYLQGFLRAAFAFKATARPLPFVGASKKKIPNYENLKAQCVDMTADKFNDGEVYIAPTTSFAKDRIRRELASFKERDSDKEGTFKIIKKEEQKKLLGHSPDFGDMIIMRKIFDLIVRRRARTSAG